MRISIELGGNGHRHPGTILVIVPIFVFVPVFVPFFLFVLVFVLVLIFVLVSVLVLVFVLVIVLVLVIQHPATYSIAAVAGN